MDSQGVPTPPITSHLGKDIPVYDENQQEVGTAVITDVRITHNDPSGQAARFDISIEVILQRPDQPYRLGIRDLLDFSLHGVDQPPNFGKRFTLASTVGMLRWEDTKVRHQSMDHEQACRQAVQKALADALRVFNGVPRPAPGTPIPLDLTPCCDMHTTTCEPPSELCCHSCSEAQHPEHPSGIPCVLRVDPRWLFALPDELGNTLMEAAKHRLATAFLDEAVVGVVGEALWEEVKRWPHEPMHPGGTCSTILGLTGKDLARVALRSALRILMPDAPTSAPTDHTAPPEANVRGKVPNPSAEPTPPASEYLTVWVNSHQPALLLEQPHHGQVVSERLEVAVETMMKATPTGPYRVIDRAHNHTFGQPATVAELVTMLSRELGPTEPETYRPVRVEAGVHHELRAFLQFRCLDDGPCHYACHGGDCWRVRNAGPLSGLYPGDDWPAETKERAMRAHIENMRTYADTHDLSDEISRGHLEEGTTDE